jgi:hypothetical protein
MSYLDQILDRFGHDGDKVIYELYLQNNIMELCSFNIDDFEEIYYSIFDDEVEELEEYVDIFDEDFNDRISLFYSEILHDCKEQYSYVRFLCEIHKTQWPVIIEKNQEIQNIRKEVRIFDYYNKLKSGSIIKRIIPE